MKVYSFIDLERRIAGGDADAMVELARYFIEADEDKKADNLYRRAAARGR